MSLGLFWGAHIRYFMGLVTHMAPREWAHVENYLSFVLEKNSFERLKYYMPAFYGCCHRKKSLHLWFFKSLDTWDLWISKLFPIFLKKKAISIFWNPKLFHWTNSKHLLLISNCSSQIFGLPFGIFWTEFEIIGGALTPQTPRYGWALICSAFSIWCSFSLSIFGYTIFKFLFESINTVFEMLKLLISALLANSDVMIINNFCSDFWN